MATITNKKTVREILESNGTCDIEPIPIVYQYVSTLDGKEHFAIFSSYKLDDLQGNDTPFCRDVTCLMVNSMLTAEGERWLENRKN